MLIFQKNFNNNGKTFDPLAHYRQQQAQNAIFGNQASAASSAGKLPDGASNGTGVHVQAPQPGDPNFDWGSTQFGNPNNFFTQEVIKTNREVAGLDPDTGRGSGMKKQQEKLNERFGSNANAGGSTTSGAASVGRFDEAAIRKQYESQGYTSDQVNTAVAEARRAHENELAATATSSQKVAGVNATTSAGGKDVTKLPNPKGGTVVPQKEIKDVAEIDTTAVEQDEALPTLSADQQAKVDRIKKMNATKGKIKQGFNNAKTKAVETWGKWSENYGDGLTGSLAGDAALAAGGALLAGGAYRLLKKRREKKRAEKEALENRVSK